MGLNSAFSSRNGIVIYILVALIAIALFSITSYIFKVNNSPVRQYEIFQKNYTKYALALDEKAQEIRDIIVSNPKETWPLTERSLKQTETLAQVYQNDTLLFWNNQIIGNEILFLPDNFNDTILELGTGWFLLSRLKESTFSIFLLKEIKTNYDVENSYLPSIINSNFVSCSNLQLTADLTESDFSLKNLNGQPVIGLIINPDEQLRKNSIFVLFILFLAIFVSIALIINKIADMLKVYLKSNVLVFIAFCCGLVLLRFLDFYFDIPPTLKHSFLFITNETEGNWKMSAGDQILNSILLLFVSIKLFFITRNTDEGITLKNSGGKIVLLIFFGAISYLLNYAIYHTIHSLEYHSLLGIQFNDIYGYTAFFVVLVLTISLFLFLIVLQRIIVPCKESILQLAAVMIVLGSIYFLLYGIGDLVLPVTFGLIMLSVLILVNRAPKQDIRIIKFIVLLILFSISSALLINSAEFDSRDQHQEKMAELFKNPDDLELEKAFQLNYPKILSDKNIVTILNDSLSEATDLQEYIASTYFNQFLQKFDIQLTLCEPEDLLEIQPDGIIVGCDDYFNELIFNSQIIPGNNSLFIIERRPDRIIYLGKISLPLKPYSDKTITLYLQFFFNYVPEGLGYPELLVDNVLSELDLTGYSYAIYKDDQLNYKFGNFAFNTSFTYLEKFPNDIFFDLAQYRHYKVEFEPNHFIVLSRPVTRISEKLVTFSVLFLCFICITFFTLVFVFGRKTYEQVGLSLRNRLQILFVSTISVVIALMALITLIYLESNNQNKMEEQLNEKTYSVIIELEHKLKGYSSLTEADPESLYEMLGKFSLVFFSDINLYNASGQLLASSRPEIFTKGLLSENINPMAFEELIMKNKLFFTTRETIGTASYYSSYAPFYLDSSVPAGIVNLPYFARQTEVRQSYYLMLFTFINLFVIFGIIGAFVALLLSKVIAKPLLLLQQRIGSLRIDKENEKIEWHREDEIGQLIAEYNRMVDKLEQSADLLKHSERESAWREVALQIAHEIKNPLTPMKLNVQYLEKYITSRDKEVDEKIKSISSSLISQIDSLDRVAEMFSDFAKTNAGNLEKVNLLSLLESSVLLFKNHSQVEFIIETEGTNNDFYTPAIEKDLLRVFNNLLKNAIQAIETRENGTIKISFHHQSGFILVSIADNGKGIKDQSKAKIFQPYFTTKSGGTGLGLAIVKNIMTEIGGEIDFESKENEGTVFTLKFRSY